MAAYGQKEIATFINKDCSSLTKQLITTFDDYLLLSEQDKNLLIQHGVPLLLFKLIDKFLEENKSVTKPKEDSWPWISRDVEAKMKEAFSRDSLLIHIKGRRRIGKSSTTSRLFKELQKPFEQIYVVANDEKLVADLNTAMKKNATNISEVGIAMEQHIRDGFTFVLDEIQNSSNNFQSELQKLCDTIDRENLKGGIVIMGSIPQLVNDTLSYSKPLFGRFTTSFTICPFSVVEWKCLMNMFNIEDPMLMLTFYSLFGGNPSLYKILHQQQLLRNNVTRSELVNAIFASRHQYIAQHSYTDELGRAESIVIKSLSKQLKAGKSQIEEMSRETGLTKDKILEILQALQKKSIVETIRKKEVYSICDPSLQLYSLLESVLLMKICHRLETLVRQIIKFRIFRELGLFPDIDFANIKTKVSINKEDFVGFKQVEIDLLFEVDDIQIFGSIKRNFSKLTIKNLNDHVEKFYEQNKAPKKQKSAFIFIGTTATKEEKAKLFSQSMSYTDTNRKYYAFTLTDLLADF